MSQHAPAAPTQNPVVFDSHYIKNIPSLELQTLAFMQSALASGTPQELRLSRNGFHVWLDFEPEFTIKDGSSLKNIFTITDVYVPIKCRFRGWLTHYWQLCQLQAGGSLLIFGAPPPKLRSNMQRHGFKEVMPQFWLIQA